ncbi:MAG: DNA gyrase inhibitor YacG [Geminicoccaceae bacterium]
MTDDTKPKKTPRCPQCGKPRDLNFRPFCSARCRDLDFGKWLNGSYAIPAVEADEEFPEEDIASVQEHTDR